MKGDLCYLTPCDMAAGNLTSHGHEAHHFRGCLTNPRPFDLVVQQSTTEWCCQGDVMTRAKVVTWADALSR